MFFVKNSSPPRVTSFHARGDKANAIGKMQNEINEWVDRSGAYILGTSLVSGADSVSALVTYIMPDAKS